MKSRPTNILQILTSIYAVLYVAAVVSTFFETDLTPLKVSDYLFVVLFLMFLVGFIMSWTRKKTAGIIFMLWVAGVWICDLCLWRGQDSGMPSMMAVPALIIGALLMLKWYNTTIAPMPSGQLKWKFVLRILLINYAVLYAIVIVSELTASIHRDYFSIPFIIFPFLLLVFILGFALSWKREFVAGIIFLFWSAFLIAGFIYSSVLYTSGPWLLFVIPILLQGLFYIKNHLMYRSKA
jgi:hypothetical protein